jgi:hypothetical protein
MAKTVPDDCLGEEVTATDKGGCEPGKQPDNQTNHCRRYKGRQALQPLEEIQKPDDGGVVCNAQQPQQGSGNQVVWQRRDWSDCASRDQEIRRIAQQGAHFCDGYGRCNECRDQQAWCYASCELLDYNTDAPMAH